MQGTNQVSNIEERNGSGNVKLKKLLKDTHFFKY